jgi:hypothetical protein
MLPFRRIPQCFVVLCERVFDLALLHEYIAPSLDGIRPVRPFLIGEFKLRLRSPEIPVLAERDAPGVVRSRQVGCKRDSLGIGFLSVGPVTATVE